MPDLALREYVSLQRGNTYKSALLGLPGPKLLGLGSIQRNGGFKSESLKSYGGESHPKILLVSGDIYVSLKDVTQSADLLGAVARVPDGLALKAFNALANPMLDRIVANIHESHTLAATRDLLLPKLMSGDLRVHEASVAPEHCLAEAR